MRTTFPIVLCLASGIAMAQGPAPRFTNGLEGDAPSQVVADTSITLSWAAISMLYCTYGGSSFPGGVSFQAWPQDGQVCVAQPGGTSNCGATTTATLRLTRPGTYRFNVNCYASSGSSSPLTSTALVAVVDRPTSDGVTLGLAASTPGPVAPGATFNYAVSLRNDGMSRLTEPTLSLALPAALSYGSNDCGAAIANGRLAWSLPNGLAVGGTATCNVGASLTTIPAEETVTSTANVAFSIAGVPFTLATTETTGTTHRARPLSTTQSGVPTTRDSGAPSLSGDGRVLAFATLQTGLADGDAASDGANIVLRNRTTGQRLLVNVDANGQRLRGTSGSPALSANARAVAFVYTPSGGAAVVPHGSAASVFGGITQQMCSAPPNGLFRPVCDATNPAGQPLNGDSRSPSLSGDGKLLAFCSSASNWVAGDTNSALDVFVKNQETGVVTLASTDASGAQGQGDSCDPAISGDGGYVTFRTRAPNLGGTAQWQVVRKDLASGAIELLSASPAGTPANADVGRPSTSYDGSRVAFASRATNLLAGFTNNLRNVYMAERGGDANLAAGPAPKGTGGGLFGVRDPGGGPPNGDADDPAISCNGRVIGFGSTATDLVPGEIGDIMDVFMADADSGVVRRGVAGASGTPPNGASTNPVLDCEGNTTVFQSTATNLDPSDPNGNADIYGQDDPLRSDAGAVTIDASYSGNWYNPGQNGHGLLLEALPLPGNPYYVTWYLYVGGETLFLQGVAVPQGNVINATMYSTRSNGFPIGPAGPINTVWGALRLTFTDSNSGRVDWFPTAFGFTNGGMNLRRLTHAALVESDLNPTVIKACYSGVWNEPARNGYGVDLEVADIGGGRLLTAYWYTYEPDGSPLWLAGAGTSFRGTVTMDLYEGGGAGAEFPPAFSAPAVTQTRWGTANFRFTSDDALTLTYTPAVAGYAAGAVNLTRLTSLRGRECR